MDRYMYGYVYDRGVHPTGGRGACLSTSPTPTPQKGSGLTPGLTPPPGLTRGLTQKHTYRLTG